MRQKSNLFTAHMTPLLSEARRHFMWRKFHIHIQLYCLSGISLSFTANELHSQIILISIIPYGEDFVNIPKDVIDSSCHHCNPLNWTQIMTIFDCVKDFFLCLWTDFVRSIMSVSYDKLIHQNPSLNWILYWHVH